MSPSRIDSVVALHLVLCCLSVYLCNLPSLDLSIHLLFRPAAIDTRQAQTIYTQKINPDIDKQKTPYEQKQRSRYGMSTIPHNDQYPSQPSILPHIKAVRDDMANKQTNLSLYTVSALLILDSDGARVLAKYYTPPHQAAIGTGLVADLGVGAGGPGMGLSGLKEQKAFEKSIWEKVKRGGGESHFISAFRQSAARQIPSPYFTCNRMKDSTLIEPLCYLRSRANK
jgi:hypothetical protein